MKVAIINNGYLGMVRQWQEFFYQRRYAATPISGPDFKKLAEAFGVWGATVTARTRRSWKPLTTFATPRQSRSGCAFAR